MSNFPAITFSTSMSPAKGAIVFLVSDKHGDKPKLPASAAKFDADNRITNALKVAEFKGTVASVVEILAPEKGIDRILIAGIGKSDGTDENDWMKIGGKIMASIGKSTEATIITELAEKGAALAPQSIAAMAAGAKLRTYSFDTYKTKNKDKPKPVKLSFVGANAAAAKKSWASAEAVADGVVFARDLMDEPANILGPVEFAKRAAELKKLGCEIEILDEKKLKTEKMGALLGVAQGSVRPARVVIMRWNGGKTSAKPVAFVGKGVVFDTGGISIKPAAGMEDMKGDMGGAAAVCGVMHALAARKAKVNAVGIIGLVENMPDANAQRPGDIVVSRSGQTIEVLNTDAEGRLVLADLLWYCEDKYKPQFMVNLATLTGAIIIALGNTHAGLFSNSDELSERLTTAGKDTAELLWRMPLAAEYDKLIDSKNADMKNIGGRHAGSITAAQFLQRFVRDAPWAHLDIAGTAMGSPKTEYSQGWASGFGVRLLNRLVANHYE